MVRAISRGIAPACVCFVTLGCAKNEVDTQDMTRLLEEAGYAVVCDPALADVLVVNTCSFIQAAVEESIDCILELADAPRVREMGIPIIVAGCLPSRYGDDLTASLDEATAFLPCADEGKIVDLVAAALAGRECEGSSTSCAPACGGKSAEVPASGDEAPDTEDIAPASGDEAFDSEDKASASGDEAPSWAYVKISDGCDRWCSYCTIPLIRGRYHSFTREAIFEDVRRKVAQGVRECVLIGQDTGLWGSDFDEPSSLASLLTGLADEFPETWFRALYTQPEHVTDELLEALATKANLTPYLDIPMQHADASLLHAMNRKGSREAFEALIAHAREKVPGIALRTTLIAGFPGESEEAFESLVDFVEESALDYVGVFAYSREEGTRAAEMDGQLDEEEKAYRAERLRTVADAVSASVVSKRVGTVFPVLVEGVEEDGQLFGRAIIQAPEVDGITYLDAGTPGEIVEVGIDGTFLYDMEGTRQ